MFRVKMYFAMAGLIFSFNFALGQTIITGPIDTSQVWTEDGSPYIIQGEVNTFDGLSLEIEAGSTVLFEAGASLGLSSHSVFIAQGTEENPILFSSNAASPQPGDYIGIILGEVDNVEMSHCIIEFAQFGLFIFVPVTVEDVEIRHCIDGMHLAHVGGEINGFNIHNNTRYGVLVGADLTSAIMRYCTISNNGLVGVQTSVAWTAVGADHCIIQGNGGDGMFATGPVTNCNISNNGGFGLILVGGISASNNTIVGNSGFGIGVRDVLPHESVHVNWCNIYNNGNYDFAVAWSCYTPSIDATNNFWGTQDVEIISTRILDVNDDSDLTSQVVFSPYEGTVETESKTFGGIKSLYRDGTR